MNRDATGVCAARGFRAAGVAAGLKADDALDIALIASDRPAAAVGVFTTNLVCGAPVLVTRKHVSDGRASAIVVNAGNANTCTGEQGERDAIDMCQRAAHALGIDPHDVLVASTGVIGRPLPMDLVASGVAQAATAIGDDGGNSAARAIMTTDTVPKQSVRTVDVAGQTITVGGMAKGAGMIAPRLATMLAFITTDADLASEDLHKLLAAAAETSFNRVTVDGDTSTSDMVLLMANGASGAGRPAPGSPDHTAFGAALAGVCRDLAEMIAKDGEGATRYVTVRVSGAVSNDDARMAARTVAESPLVKTAVFGGDPNWGRIAAALGRSGAAFDPLRLRVWADDLLLFESGMPAAFDLKDAERHFQQPVLTIAADLGAGAGAAEVYTCDLSYDYVRINAEYTT